MKTIAGILVVLVGVGAVLAWPRLLSGGAAVHESGKLVERVFELRTYHTNDEMLDHLHARFRDHTNYLFVKHGMTLVGYWTPVDEENTLVYLLAHSSREAAEKSWNAFRNDPEWQRVYKASHEKAGGRIVKKGGVASLFLEPTDYSPIR